MRAYTATAPFRRAVCNMNSSAGQVRNQTAVRYIALSLSLVVLCGGSAVMIGWIMDIPVLESIHPHWVTMKFNTALCFVLGGIGLFTHIISQPRLDDQQLDMSWPRRIVVVFAVSVVFMITIAALLEYFSGIDLGIDNILVAEGPTAYGTSNLGRMSPVTAFDFLFLTVAYGAGASRSRSLWRLSQVLSLIAMAIAYIAMLGYVFGIESFYRVSAYTSIAFYTAILLMLMAATTILLRPVGITRLLAGTDAGGVLARLLLPAAFILSPLMGWFWLQGEEHLFYSPRSGLAIYVVSNVALFAGLISWAGFTLHRYDIQRSAWIERLAAKRRRLQDFSDALEQSNIELRRFAYVASHDLQTPLRSIMSFTQLMQRSLEGKMDSETRDWMRRVITNAGRMQALIQNLLDYSRIGMQSTKSAEVNMNEVLQSAMEMLHANIVESGANIVSTPLPIVYGDMSQLTQLLQNLIGNAIKYRGDKPPSIRISVEKNDSMYRFAVQDNGIGIDAKHQERIFEIFQRLHVSQAYQGTGIGLAICRRVVESHGGKIWVESQPGAGSTFYFTLPLTAGSNHEHSH